MPADERQLAVNWSAWIEFQIVVDLERPPVFINAEDADVEIEAWVLEVVGVSQIKCAVLLCHRDAPDLVVTFVVTEMILAALIMRDDDGTQPVFFFDLLLIRRIDILA